MRSRLPLLVGLVGLVGLAGLGLGVRTGLADPAPPPVTAVAPDHADGGAALHDHRWAIETEAIQPFVPTVGIARVRVTRHLWGAPAGAHGDLVVGVYLRPGVEHDVVETIDEYMATLGVRYFLWRGLHAEALLDAGLAWGTNKVDQMAYRTATLFAEVNLGYRVGLFAPGGVAGAPRAVGVYVAPQVGLLSSLGVGNDIGPRNGKPDYFLTAALLLGASF
ncbi:MAG: hypothetical protein KBG48_32240 [Kofleriaceae bacterium]|nr:hypothetical protein [Kofleriaceae bacterium]MBP9172105.1 hypothetical protein [Kofleriaceae bacterium]MBP9859578.1 hypothetical protein [Kofleriaceae bacterium]